MFGTHIRNRERVRGATRGSYCEWTHEELEATGDVGQLHGWEF